MKEEGDICGCENPEIIEDGHHFGAESFKGLYGDSGESANTCLVRPLPAVWGDRNARAGAYITPEAAQFCGVVIADCGGVWC